MFVFTFLQSQTAQTPSVESPSGSQNVPTKTENQPDPQPQPTALLAGVELDEDPQSLNEAKMRSELLRKQKELLEIQQKKIELELFQAKARLEEQQKQITKGIQKQVQLNVEEVIKFL